MKNALLALMFMATPLQAFAGLEKYTYTCKSDARYYSPKFPTIQHDIVPVGMVGYPRGHLSGLIWWKHQIGDEVFNLSAQGGLGWYNQQPDERFSIDLFRSDVNGRQLDAATLEIYSLDSLPLDVGVRLAHDVKLADGGWANFTLRCEWTPQ